MSFPDRGAGGLLFIHITCVKCCLKKICTEERALCAALYIQCTGSSDMVVENKYLAAMVFEVLFANQFVCSVPGRLWKS